MRWLGAGRLFWKLLLILWVSMLLSILATAAYFHWREPFRQAPPPASHAAGPPASGPHGMGPPPHAVPLPPLVSGAVASLLTSWLLAWYLSRPLMHLRWALREVGEGRFHTRVSPRMGRRRDEIVDLAHDFDRMAAELEKLTDAQRELFHDVSHELRSPLHRMQVALGLLRQDQHSLPQAMARLEREGQRLEELIDELLTLHRLEAGALTASVGEIDVMALIETLVDDAVFEARGTGLEVVMDGRPAFVAEVCDELLCRAFENVIRNALKFSPPHGRVVVQTRVRADEWVCHVMDQGPGVPESRLEDIFRPFVRVEGAEPRQGSGLGLAIARRAMAWHGGSVRAHNRPGGGLCVTLSLPRARQADACAA
ncbi:MAG: sensory histidine kinase in two-component regulatory system with CpxR [Pseudomonadota bacterium]